MVKSSRARRVINQRKERYRYRRHWSGSTKDVEQYLLKGGWRLDDMPRLGRQTGTPHGVSSAFYLSIGLWQFFVRYCWRSCVVPSTFQALDLALDVARRGTRISDIDRVLELYQTKPKSRLSRCTTEASISQDRLSTRSSFYIRSSIAWERNTQ